MIDADSARSDIERCITEMHSAGELPPDAGVAVAVVSDTELVFLGGFGLRDRERRLEVTPDTLFEAGSFQKAFTATALALAEDAGKLSLSAPLGAVVELKDAGAGEPVTLDELLSHRTGLPAHDFLWLFSGVGQPELTRRLRLLDRVPGHGFSYSNLAYAAAAIAFEQLTGESFAASVQTHLRAPLGLSPGSGTADVAKGYAGGRFVAACDVSDVGAAGGLRASVRDLARWLQFHLSGGLSPSGERVVPVDALATTYRTRVTADAVGPLLLRGLGFVERPGYGLGWFTGFVRGEPVLFHPEWIDGFSGAVLLMPGQRIGLAVLANENLTPAPGRLIQRLLSRALGAPIPAPTEPSVVLPPVPPRGGVARAVTPPGVYEDPAYGPLELRYDEHGPRLKYGSAEWLVTLLNDVEGMFPIDAFGVQLPMSARFEADRVLIPLSMDPRVPPQTFIRRA